MAPLDPLTLALAKCVVPLCFLIGLGLFVRLLLGGGRESDEAARMQAMNTLAAKNAIVQNAGSKLLRADTPDNREAYDRAKHNYNKALEDLKAKGGFTSR